LLINTIGKKANKNIAELNTIEVSLSAHHICLMNHSGLYHNYQHKFIYVYLREEQIFLKNEKNMLTLGTVVDIILKHSMKLGL